MATDAELQAALTFGNNHTSTTAKTVNAAQLARIKAWFTATYTDSLGGETVTSDDIACWLWRQVNGKVTLHENQVRDAANEAAAISDLTS
ncbi:hypothetical protein [uncultured Mediterranean phage]|nr:hypothetical protein [uncultured Mediterranean phage]